MSLDETTERPGVLHGTTYKMQPTMWEFPLYVTINDMVFYGGTEVEVRRPFEIFISSKNMEQFEWIVALTRLMSAVFRKGGNIDFVIEEMKSIYSPLGGYMQKGTGVWMHSVVAELGHVIERHMKQIGVVP